MASVPQQQQPVADVEAEEALLDVLCKEGQHQGPAWWRKWAALVAVAVVAAVALSRTAASTHPPTRAGVEHSISATSSTCEGRGCNTDGDCCAGFGCPAPGFGESFSQCELARSPPPDDGPEWTLLETKNCGNEGHFCAGRDAGVRCCRPLECTPGPFATDPWSCEWQKN